MPLYLTPLSLSRFLRFVISFHPIIQISACIVRRGEQTTSVIPPKRSIVHFHTTKLALLHHLTRIPSHPLHCPHYLAASRLFLTGALVARRHRSSAWTLATHVIAVVVHVSRHVAKHRTLALLLLMLHFQALAANLEAVHSFDRSVSRRGIVVAHETCTITASQLVRQTPFPPVQSEMHALPLRTKAAASSSLFLHHNSGTNHIAERSEVVEEILVSHVVRYVKDKQIASRRSYTQQYITRNVSQSHARK